MSGVRLFVAALAARVLFVAMQGRPYPKGPRADENVYLELAWNLFAHGEYGSRVSTTYPPLYPMFVAPSFVLESNDLRFAVLYAAQALLTGLATLTLLPALRTGLGRDGAWYALAAAQALAGITTMSMTAQSEPLFAALLIAATGLVHSAWERDTAWRFLTLGALAGLAVTTRRMALVMPVALGLLLVQDAWSSRTLLAPLRRGLLLTGGFAIGWVPEVVATRLHGAAIETYADGVAGRHLDAATMAFASADRVWLAVQVASRQLAYLDLIAFAAPIVLPALLLGKRTASAPQPLSRFAWFAVWTSWGLAAMTALHILRYSFQVAPGKRWDVYPRYLDPAEIPLLLALLALVGWAVRTHGRDALRGAGAWLLAGAALIVLAGPMSRPRGGRLLAASTLRELGFGAAAPWVFPAICVLGLAAAAFLLLRGDLARARGAGAAFLLSWAIAPHTVSGFLRAVPEPEVGILAAGPIQADPRAPLGVVVRRPGPYGRPHYAPAFRSDHRVDFLRPGEADEWAATHPGGFLLGLRSDGVPDGAGRVGDWWFVASDTWKREGP